MLVKDYFNRRFPQGEIGIEIEVEGRNLDFDAVMESNYWKAVDEGSLRGAGVEYILRSPVFRKEVYDALNELYYIYMDEGIVPYRSDRTSVHVHVNVSKMEILQMFNAIFLFYAVERLLLKWCGEDREGNLFCLPSYDAEKILMIVKQVAKEQNLHRFYDDIIRYSAMNLKAIPERGSIEFRSMRGTADFSKICHWVKIITLIFDYAKTIATPTDILEMFSQRGPENMFLEIFKGEYEELKYPGWEKDVRDSVRNIQFLISSQEWRDFEPTIEPFGDV